MTEAKDYVLLFTQPRTCVGCRTCEVFCAYRHYGENNPARALLHVVKDEELCVDAPVVCQHCGGAPCITACSVGAITRDPKTGAVVIDQKECLQCRACMAACPFGAILVDPKTGLVSKCDLCGGDPICAQVCPKHAIMFTKRSVGPKLLMRAANKQLVQSVSNSYRARAKQPPI